jgi:hypothetical protein
MNFQSVEFITFYPVVCPAENYSCKNSEERDCACKNSEERDYACKNSEERDYACKNSEERDYACKNSEERGSSVFKGCRRFGRKC